VTAVAVLAAGAAEAAEAAEAAVAAVAVEAAVAGVWRLSPRLQQRDDDGCWGRSSPLSTGDQVRDLAHRVARVGRKMNQCNNNNDYWDFDLKE
jgi:hypothetical protein